MTVKISKATGHPLLQEPLSIESMRWAEITPEIVLNMNNALRENADKGEWARNTTMLRAMKTLGLDVSGWVKTHTKEMNSQLKELSAHAWGPDQVKKIEYVTQIAAMKALGLDVSRFLNSRSEWYMRVECKKFRENREFQRYLTYLAEMKRAGLDVAGEVRGHKRELIEGKNWGPLSGRYAELKTLGLLAADGIPKKEKTKMQEEFGNLSPMASTWGSWIRYAIHAANMAELGLLTPNPQYRAPEARMPPLKKFRSK
jgi:hypothetical protein